MYVLTSVGAEVNVLHLACKRVVSLCMTCHEQYRTIRFETTEKLGNVGQYCTTKQQGNV